MLDKALEGLMHDLAMCSNDPFKYVLWAFPWGVKGTPLEKHKGPRKWQRKILWRIGEELRKGRSVDQAIRIAIASGHGVGKSAVVAWITKWALSTLVDTRVVITANTEKQLETKTSPELAKWHHLGVDRRLFHYATTSLTSLFPGHEKTWRADLIPWSEHNTEAFAGLHNEGKRIVLIFDEASKIADKVWEVAEGALTDAMTEILWLVFGNPTRATGRFRECWRKFKHRWIKEQIDSRTVEGTNKAQIEQWIEDYGVDSDFVKVRVRGMFPSASAKQFISEKDADAGFGRKLPLTAIEWAPKIIAVEPSWEGDDEFVIGLRQGLLFKILGTYEKNDNDVEMANIIARFEDDEHADAVFIDAGYGTGIYSVGNTLGRAWMLVWFAAAGDDPGDLNKRASMWRLMRDWLKAGGAYPADEIMHDELIAPETVPRLDGKLQLESKKDMKARGVPSPNRADDCAITFAFPVMPKSGPMSIGRGKRQTVDSEWDPLEDEESREAKRGKVLI